MPLQNRVLPTGEIVVSADRGTLTGNRGILHGPDGRLGSARWRHKAWITCALQWKGVRRVPMTPGTWTELFFHDEAVACAAGHRPCALCRRAAFDAFSAAWARAFGAPARAPEIDACLHKARVDPHSRAQITHTARIDDLPDGCFVDQAGQPARVQGAWLLPFLGTGYAAAVPRSGGIRVTVLTPAPTVAVMRAGWKPAV